MAAKTIHQRYHGLDLLRSVAMLLGLVIHAPLIYYTPELAREFQFFGSVPSAGLGTDFAVLWIHAWRMPTFFLLAGFFAVLVLQRKNLAWFARDRAVRIGLTMFVFMVWMSWMSWMSDESLSTLYHYWFLYYLLAIIAGFIPLYWLVARLSTFLNFSTVTWVVSRPLIFVPVAILLLWPLTLGAREYGFGAIIPEQFGDFDVVPFLYYCFWFALGALIYCSRDVLKRLESNRVLIVMAVFAIGSYLVQFFSGAPLIFIETETGFEIRNAIPLNVSLLIGAVSTITTVTWSLLAIGLAHRLLKVAHPVVNWLVELSYSIYLFHHFFTVMIGGLLLHTGWAPIAAIGVNILLTFVICVACYYIFIKFTPLNWIINGYRKSWLKLPRRPKQNAVAS